MAGYNYRAGMSNNAVEAYSEGRKPLSAITRADLDRVGLQHVSVKFACWMAKENYWPTSEWHHSSGWYNKIDFYDPDELAEYLGELSTDEFERIKAAYNASYTKQEEQRVSGEFTIWGGTRKKPVRIGVQKFTGTLKGKWIVTDSGERKLASGNHITWVVSNCEQSRS